MQGSPVHRRVELNCLSRDRDLRAVAGNRLILVDDRVDHVRPFLEGDLFQLVANLGLVDRFGENGSV